jgi:hypothetical protein
MLGFRSQRLCRMARKAYAKSSPRLALGVLPSRGRRSSGSINLHLYRFSAVLYQTNRAVEELV